MGDGWCADGLSFCVCLSSPVAVAPIHSEERACLAARCVFRTSRKLGCWMAFSENEKSPMVLLLI